MILFNSTEIIWYIEFGIQRIKQATIIYKFIELFFKCNSTLIIYKISLYKTDLYRQF